MTTVLDSFNAGATQALSARAGWGTGHWSGTLDLQTDAGPTYATTGLGTPAGNIWAGNLTSDHEVSFTYGSVIGSLLIVARVNSSSAPSAGYVGNISNGGTTDLELRSGASISGGTVLSPSAGDTFWLGCLGSFIYLDYQPAAGARSTIQSATDTTYTVGTFIGIHVGSGSPRIDSFGGDPVLPAPGMAGINFLRKGDRRA